LNFNKKEGPDPPGPSTTPRAPLGTTRVRYKVRSVLARAINLGALLIHCKPEVARVESDFETFD